MGGLSARPDTGRQLCSHRVYKTRRIFCCRAPFSARAGKAGLALGGRKAQKEGLPAGGAGGLQV